MLMTLNLSYHFEDVLVMDINFAMNIKALTSKSLYVFRKKGCVFNIVSGPCLYNQMRPFIPSPNIAKLNKKNRRYVLELIKKPFYK